MKTIIIQSNDKNVSPLSSMESIYDIPALLASSKPVGPWFYNNTEIQLPYSVNAFDGHSNSYAKGTFTFTSTITIHKLQPTYLWFDHADKKTEVYLNGTTANDLVDIHYGGYNSFFIDITNSIIIGTNTLTIKLTNNSEDIAPVAGDFNFNATLGVVKILTSPVLPAIEYGYDGFHVSASSVSSNNATLTIKTSIPTFADVVCHINDENYNYTSRKFGKGEIIFTTTINNPHLWDGKNDPHLYNITLELYYNGELCHKLTTHYGIRYYSYVINDSTVTGYDSNNPYTGFLLNGHPYLLRGVCMHQDLEGKANALTTTDIDHDFDILLELNVNFIRTAHYPHPKQFYDYCDKLGIVVQTEVPCVNKMQSTMSENYYTHLTGQYNDMINQHYNHPCIMFWGLSNETSTDDKDFAKAKIESYVSQIKALDSERMVGYVLNQGNGSNPSAYYNDPSNVDWFGCNIYVGWYDTPNSNNPTTQINTRLNNTVNNVSVHKPMAYSEYGCGGNQRCHSDDPTTTTTRGTNQPRHDIEYQMWLHEGHIAAIKNFPQLLYTSMWVLFDFAVTSRQEGYTICLDGINTTTDDNCKFLNNKGLVERDHITKKDTFYLYKAWWNTSDKFIHICGKNYQKLSDRVIKCYTNESTTLSLYINDTKIEEKIPSNYIVEFTSTTFTSGDEIKVVGDNSQDIFTI